VRIPFRVAVLGYDETAPAVLEELSTDGCRLSMADGIAVGTSLAIVIQESLHGRHVLGTVVRSEPGTITVRFDHIGAMAAVPGAPAATGVYVI
jgi:hypothetical protein